MRHRTSVGLLVVAALALAAGSGGALEPAAPGPKKGLLRPPPEKVGTHRCRACHRLQYDSWVKSGHARKALDCEGCHGHGADYARAEVMKDPAAARSAGLILQTAAFCEKCHPTADASFLPRAHAHGRKGH
jgi:hypothetical protein